MLMLLIALGLGLLALVGCFSLTWLTSGSKSKAWVAGGIGGGIGVSILPLIIKYLATLYTSYLLYQSMELAEVFLRRLTIYWALFGIGFAAALIFLLINVSIAAAIIPGKMSWPYRLIAGALVLLVALLFGVTAGGTWDEILLWLNQVPFGRTDPLFGRDISWYVFSYPFYSRLIGWGFCLVVLGSIATAVVYGAQAMVYHEAAKDTWRRYGDSEAKEKEAAVWQTMIRHLGILAALLALLLAGYWILRRVALPIDAFSFLGYAGKKIQGAGWVDHHFVAWTMSILPWFSLAIGAACLAASFRRDWRTLAWAIGAKFLYIVVILGISTMLVWTIAVRPRELARETPYIQWSNKATLEAYGLGPDTLAVQEFPAKGLTAGAITEAPVGVLENLRLLDPFEVFLRNVDQDEEQRSYYDFLDPDIDFYRYADGSVVQVMTSARELPVDQIPTRTWINDHLVFTHGRGVTMAQVNAFDAEGNMVYLVRGLPGKGPFVPKQEALYYGEACEQWIATGTTEKEVGPPTPGGGWEEIEYEGKGGVLLGSGLRRLAFAIRFNDLTLLLTDRLRPETRIHFRRNIQERVSDIAPFLWLDDDPYIPVGQDYLWWMWDGATWASRYPYGDAYKVADRTLRYLRPSVKITMDAYNGVPEFYEVDPTDPVLQAWKRVFPTLFKPLSEMPEELQAHIRYPEQVFIVQAKVLRRHHMTDTIALYNEEDLWEIAKEYSLGQIRETAPRYVLTVLPDEEEVEYILDWSYTRINKQNGIAFLAARSKPEYYGKLILYAYPIGKMILGPALVENLIDQDPVLAEKITLLSQQQKEVIRGNLITLPLRDSVIYVKPIYVRATTAGGGEGLPQLRFVVVGSVERKIAFGRTLDEAFHAFVQEEVMVPERIEKERPAVVPVGCEELWQKLQAAINTRDAAEAARISVELLAKGCR